MLTDDTLLAVDLVPSPPMLTNIQITRDLVYAHVNDIDTQSAEALAILHQ